MAKGGSMAAALCCPLGLVLPFVRSFTASNDLPLSLTKAPVLQEVKEVMLTEKIPLLFTAVAQGHPQAL